jgi:hypothetical protein
VIGNGHGPADMTKSVGIMGIHQYIEWWCHGTLYLGGASLFCFFTGLIINYYSTGKTKSRPAEIKKALRQLGRRALGISLLFVEVLKTQRKLIADHKY